MSRIIIIGPAYPLRGGIANYTERLAKAFKDAGNDVEIYTFKLQYPSILFPGKTQFASGNPPDNLKIDISINSINPLNWIAVGREIKKKRPDMIVFQYWLPFMGPCFGTIARLVKGNKHTKILSVIHNIIPHEKRPGDRMLTKYFIQPVEGFVAQSRTVVNDIKSFTATKPIKYQPHPIYDIYGDKIDKRKAREMLGLDPQQKYMLFFGFIREYKGLDLLLKAMAKPEVRTLGVKLIIAGEYYEDPKPLKDIIEDDHLQEMIEERTEFIPNEDVYKYFSACDVVVQPYKHATQSGVTQIAYHFEKPMIVTNVGGLPEIVPDGKAGYVVDPSPEAIADAIFKFYSENKEEEFTKNAAEEKKKYSWEEMVQQLKSLAE